MGRTPAEEGGDVNTRELGRWRKLWTKPSPSWEMLPAGARGLGDELLRYCDEEGRLPLMGLEPAAAIARIIRAHVSERRWVIAMLARLETDGFVRRDGTALLIRNFVTAQSAVTESAERMRSKRDRDATDERLADDRGATGGRLADDWRTTGTRQDNSATPRNSEGGRVTVTPSEERRGEERREEQQQSAREAPAAPVCPTVETATATPPRAPGAVLFAALSAGAGDAVRTMVSGDALVRFTALCHELGVDAPALRVLGEYLRHDRAAHPDRFPWRSSRGPHTAVDLGFLTRQEGENLVEFVGKARDWHASRPSEDAVAASRAAQRAAVDAAADTRGALSREETVRRASEARAALAALAPASPARRESGERGAA